MSVTAYFIGPDDSETCDWCDDAVNGGPYTIEDVPEPGDGPCMGNCRHMVQLADEAPDDIAPYTWSASVGFSTPVSKYYSDITPDQELAADELGKTTATVDKDVDESNMGAGPIDVISDETADALSESPADLAQYLVDYGLEPTDVAVELGLSDGTIAQLNIEYAKLIGESVTEENVRNLLADGEVEKLQDMQNKDEHGTLSELLDSIAKAGFDDRQADQAEVLAELLGKDAYIADDGRWYLR